MGIKSIQEFLESSPVGVEERKPRRPDFFFYNKLAKKYPEVFKEAVDMQSEMRQKLNDFVGSGRVNSNWYLVKAAEKDDFSKFWDEIAKDIVPGWRPWSELVTESTYFYALFLKEAEIINILPECGFLGESNDVEYNGGGVITLIKYFNVIYENGDVKSGGLAFNLSTVEYLKLIIRLYKGVILSDEEAAKILKSHGFLSGYDMEKRGEVVAATPYDV